MLHTGKPCAPRTRKPQLFGDSASSGFSLAWLLEFMKLFALLVISIVKKLTTQLTSNANDFMNAKSHACKRDNSG